MNSREIRMPIPKELDLQDPKIKTDGVKTTRDLKDVLQQRVETANKYLTGAS